MRAPYDFGDTWQPIVNARDDKLAASKLWIEPVATRRCLAPADTFYEWVGPKGAKYETRLRRPDGAPFFFAGVWSPDKQAGGGRGFAIVTTTPNAFIGAIPHDRMPAMLDEAGAAAWLGDEPIGVKPLIRPFAGELVREDLPPPERKKKITKKDVQSGELGLET